MADSTPKPTMFVGHDRTTLVPWRARLSVGGEIFTKLACRVKFDCITKPNVGLLLITPPIQLVETTQLVKTKLGAAFAVTLKDFPISNI